MPTRRSARVLAASALRNVAQDENNVAQPRKRRSRKPASATAKQSAQLQSTQQVLQPLQDVTNNVQNARPRLPRKEPRKPAADKVDEITPAPPRTNTQRGNQPSRHSISPYETRPAEASPGAMRCIAEAEGYSSDEIQPNPSKKVPKASTSVRDPLHGEIRVSSITQKRRRLSTSSESPNEIQPGPVRSETPFVSTTRRTRDGPTSPAISDSPPRSPLVAKPPTEVCQTLWPDEKRDLDGNSFDAGQPRQAIHTYGKRRRVARVSLPTMQALGVRAKSPSNGSESGSEQDNDGDASEEYRENDDESEERPKRDPQLQAFLAEQKRLWQEVDEINLLVESD